MQSSKLPHLTLKTVHAAGPALSHPHRDGKEEAETSSSSSPETLTNSFKAGAGAGRPGILVTIPPLLILLCLDLSDLQPTHTGSSEQFIFFLKNQVPSFLVPFRQWLNPALVWVAHSLHISSIVTFCRKAPPWP